MTVSWTVDHSDGSTTIDYLPQGVPTHTRGQTIDIQLGFDPGNTSAYTTLREFLEYAPAAATFSSVDGTPYYRTTRPGHDPLFGLDPTGASHASDTEGLWGVLVGGRDTTGPVTQSQLGLRYRIFVLAEYSDYSSRSDAKAFHET